MSGTVGNWGCVTGGVVGFLIVFVPVFLLCLISPEFNKGGGDLVMLSFFTVPIGALVGSFIGKRRRSTNLKNKRRTDGAVDQGASGEGTDRDRGL
jgi:hypothetical protein